MPATVTLTSSVAPNTGSYEWYKDNALVPSLTAQIIVLSATNESGNYKVKVIDGAGLNCESAFSAIETVLIYPGVNITASKSDISCNSSLDGTVTGVGTGGTGALTYDLETGTGVPVANTSGDASGVYTGLGAGTYRVRVTDLNLCTTVSSNVVVSEPVTLTASTTDSDYNGFDISCNGGSNGYIEVTVVGGTANYTYT
jgi:hypothetical protein